MKLDAHTVKSHHAVVPRKELGSIPLAAWGVCCFCTSSLQNKHWLLFSLFMLSYKERSFPNLLQFGKTGSTSGLLQRAVVSSESRAAATQPSSSPVSLREIHPYAAARSPDGSLARSGNLEWAMPVNRVITQPSGAMSFWYNSLEKLEVTRNYL